MDFNYIKTHLRPVNQYICAKIQYRPALGSAGDALLNKVVNWIKRMDEVGLANDGCFDGIFMFTEGVGSKDEMTMMASYSRGRLKYEDDGIHYRNWKTCWRVLPADGKWNWVPSDAIIKKALKKIEEEGK